MSKKYTQEGLKEILRLHKDWIDSEGAIGVAADFTGSNIVRSDAENYDFRGEYLRNAYVKDAWLADYYLNSTVGLSA
jgi:hypothetical protein